MKARLRVQAAQHGRSMEEVRHILRQAVALPPAPANLADLAEALFGSRGVDLEAHPAVPMRAPPDLAADRPRHQRCLGNDEAGPPTGA